MKTARELHITEAELEALVKTRCLLSGKMPEGTGFNMAITYEADREGYVDDDQVTECGTVACIGGWMAAAMGMGPMEADEYVGSKCQATSSERYPLNDLFYPDTSKQWWEITPSMAVEVIDRFLETGKVDWSSVDMADQFT